MGEDAFLSAPCPKILTRRDTSDQSLHAPCGRLSAAGSVGIGCAPSSSGQYPLQLLRVPVQLQLTGGFRAKG